MSSEKRRQIILRGSCTCGGMRFEIRGPVVGINQCHCSKCRKETGAGSSTFMPVHERQFRWISGSELVGDYDRCRVCGSLAPDHNPDLHLFNVPAGLLDDDTGVEVAHHIFISDKAGWDVIGDDAPQYDEYGPALFEREDFATED